MELKITSGERIVLLVALQQVQRLMEENPSNSPDWIVEGSKLHVEGLYNKIKEVA